MLYRIIKKSLSYSGPRIAVRIFMLLSIILIFITYYSDLSSSLRYIFPIFGIFFIIVSILFEITANNLNKIDLELRTINSFILKKDVYPYSFNLYENRASFKKDFKSLLINARKHVYIMGLNLNYLLWIDELSDEIEKSLNRGVNYKILIMNPNSPAFSLISDGSMDTSKKDQSISIDYWREFRKQIKYNYTRNISEELQIRIYDDASTIFLAIVDSQVIFSPYPQSVRSSVPIIFKFQPMEGPAFETFASYFEGLWHKSSEINQL